MQFLGSVVEYFVGKRSIWIEARQMAEVWLWLS